MRTFICIKQRWVVTLAIFVVAIASDVPAADNICAGFLDHPIFTNTTVSATANIKDQFRLMQCAANWHSAQDAESAGINATVPIFDLPVPFSASWDNKKVDQWKAVNCSTNERNGSAQLTYYSAVQTIDPATASFALKCVEQIEKAEENDAKALVCHLTETQSSYVFEARWRRTPGESDNPPKVLSFDTVNTQCQSAQALEKGALISDGGMAMLCSVGDKAGAFALNTTRGSCDESGTPRLSKVVLPQHITLTEPLFVSGQSVEVPVGATIITNGYPLTISATTLTLDGPSHIIAFDQSVQTGPTTGRSSGPISIQADDIVGVGLTVLNAGQGGGPGYQGVKGAPGQLGSPGVGRTHSAQSTCGQWLGVLCGAVTGCGAGHDGGPGGKGGTGQKGMTGFPGGSAGDVTLSVPYDERNAVLVYTDVGPDGRSRKCNGQICGGIGGQGGPGGSGGDGGPGGAGAPGTQFCNGTNNGPNGPTGDVGPSGDVGPEGVNGNVRI